MAGIWQTRRTQNAVSERAYGFESRLRYVSNITKVGIGVAVFRQMNGQTYVLLGRRKGSHGEGQWAFPGGHMEYMESFKDCAIREMAEELGPNFTVKGLRTCCVTNLKDYSPKHYVDIGMMCDYASGIPEIMEPDKVSEWKWITVSEVLFPNSTLNLFATVLNTVKAAKVYNVVTIHDN